MNDQQARRILQLKNFAAHFSDTWREVLAESILALEQSYNAQPLPYTHCQALGKIEKLELEARTIQAALDREVTRTIELHVIIGETVPSGIVTERVRALAALVLDLRNEIADLRGENHMLIENRDKARSLLLP